MSNTWNKITQPDAANGWNLIPDIQLALKTARVIIPVTGTVERGDGTSTGLFLTYGAALPIPTTVYRTDINAFETWDGTNWNPMPGSVIAGTYDTTNRTGVSTTETLMTLLSSVSLIAGHTYRMHCKFNHASTSSGTNMALSFNFKKSVTSDNTAAGTNIGSGTCWTAPAAASGKDDECTMYYRATVTETVNFKFTAYRVVGSDTFSSGSRDLDLIDEGTRA
jgi:hypothetical protein